MVFTMEQEALLKKIGITFSVQKKMNDEQLAEIDMVVTDYLIENGINEDNTVNEVGKLCEEIITIVADL